MQGAVSHPGVPPQPPSSHAWAWDLGLLTLLVGLAMGVRVWHLTHTEVAARDSIGFIRYAVQLEERPWAEVLRHSHQHPGYPILILAMSHLVRDQMGGVTSHSMQVSAQLAGGLAGVLLVFPMFYLGKGLFDRRVGFWGAALFQCLPVGGQVLSDGLSESTFLFFVASALALATRALRRHAAADFGLSGFCGGLAYLTRPEGALVVLATGLVLLGLVCLGSREWPRRQILAGGLSLLVAALAVASPFALVIGGFTTKPTGKLLLEPGIQPARGGAPAAAAPASGGPLLASLVASWRPAKDRGGLAGSAWDVGMEWVKGYHYFAWFFGAAGVWLFRGRWRESAGAWVPLVLCVVHGLVLIRLAYVVGYVSERHVLMLVLCGVYWAVAPLAALAAWPRLGRYGRPASAGLLLLLTGVGLPKTLAPMHANRAGLHAVGRWLEAHASPRDSVIWDPYDWAHYYAGRVFVEGKVFPPPAPVCYVVLEEGHHHERLERLPAAREMAKGGRPVYHWPEDRPLDKAQVRVYQVLPK